MVRRSAGSHPKRRRSDAGGQGWHPQLRTGQGHVRRRVGVEGMPTPHASMRSLSRRHDSCSSAGLSCCCTAWCRAEPPWGVAGPWDGSATGLNSRHSACSGLFSAPELSRSCVCERSAGQRKWREVQRGRRRARWRQRLAMQHAQQNSARSCRRATAASPAPSRRHLQWAALTQKSVWRRRAPQPPLPNAGAVQEAWQAEPVAAASS